MPVIGYCKNCEHRDHRGECVSGKVVEDWYKSEEEKRDKLVYSYREDGSFFVGERFGCVHFKAKKKGG